MKKNNLIINFIIILSALFALAGCIKKIDIPNTNTVSVSLNSGGAKYVTSDVTINPKDSLVFDYSITSPNDMKFVSLQKNGADILRDTLNSTNKNSFAAVKRIMADSANGVYTYRIIAKNATGIYLGSKDIVVTVSADFIYYTVRQMYVPDTSDRKNLAYFSSTTGQLFNQISGGPSSGLMDFGYYYDTTTANKHTIYALNVLQPQLSFYDISSWTKNATIFKKITTPAFTSLTSSGILQTTGVANMSSGTSSKVTALVSGNLILFKTVAGKYGVIQVNFTNADSPAAGTFMNIDVKVQK